MKLIIDIHAFLTSYIFCYWSVDYIKDIHVTYIHFSCLLNLSNYLLVGNYV